MTFTSQYSDDVKSRVRELWDQGLSDRQIAIELGWGAEGKNRVVGLRNRLATKRRGSPIHGVKSELTDEKRQQALSMVQRGYSYAATARALNLSDEMVTRVAREAGIASIYVPDTTPPVPPPAPVQAPAKYIPPSTSCCWPIGDPRTKGFRFCEDPTVPGKNYCPTHYAVAYVRMPARPREEAHPEWMFRDRAALGRGHVAGRI